MYIDILDEKSRSISCCQFFCCFLFLVQKIVNFISGVMKKNGSGSVTAKNCI